jgi:hypothetical protein
MTGLCGMAQRGLDDDRGLMASRRLRAPSGSMVASMVGPVRAFPSVLHLGDGLWIEVVVDTGACAQGATFRYYLEVSDDSGQGTRLHLFF